MKPHCATGTDISTPEDCEDNCENKEQRNCKDNCKCTEQENVEIKMAAIEEQFKRLAAEFDNYRKRALKEKVDSQTIASGKVIENLLPVLDDIQAAREQTQDIGALEIFDKLEKILATEGLQKFTCEGKLVDLETCEVAFTEIGVEDDKVTKVIRIGYKLNDKLLRTAIVAVSKKEE